MRPATGDATPRSRRGRWPDRLLDRDRESDGRSTGIGRDPARSAREAASRASSLPGGAAGADALPAAPGATASTARRRRSSRSTRPRRPTSTRRSHRGSTGDDIVLHYAIADVGWFVRPGDPLDVEAWSVASPSTCPTARSPLYPPALSRGRGEPAARRSDRPAVVFTVRVDHATVASASTASSGRSSRSRAKLAYDDVDAGGPAAGFAELARADRGRRGSSRGAPRSSSRSRSSAARRRRAASCGSGRGSSREEQNAALSLATNLAVADALLAARTGLFRVMPERRRARAAAAAPHGAGVRSRLAAGHAARPRSSARSPRDDPRTAAFLLAVRRAGGGASYAAVPRRACGRGTRRWPRRTPTPPRRCAGSPDRYVIEAALAVANGAAGAGRGRGRRSSGCPR